MHDHNIRFGVKKRLTASEKFLLTNALKSSEAENKSNREEINILRMQMREQSDKMSRILDLQLEAAERNAALQIGYSKPPNVWQRSDLYDGAVETADCNTYENFDDDVMSTGYYDDSEAFNVNEHDEATHLINTPEVNNTIAAARSVANKAVKRSYPSNGPVVNVGSSISRGNGERSATIENTESKCNKRPREDNNDRELRRATPNLNKNYDDTSNSANKFTSGKNVPTETPYVHTRPNPHAPFSTPARETPFTEPTRQAEENNSSFLPPLDVYTYIAPVAMRNIETNNPPYAGTIIVNSTAIVSPTIERWDNKSVMLLTSWWEKKVMGNATREAQWKELVTAISRSMINTAQSLIRNYLEEKRHPGSDLRVYDYTGDEFLRLMTEIFPINEESYTNTDQFHLQLIALTGKVIPMTLTEATVMVTRVFDATQGLNPEDISDANIIDCFKKWVKMVKPHKHTPSTAVDSLNSRWFSAMTGEIKVPGSNIFKKIQNLQDIIDRITKWGMAIEAVTKASKAFGVHFDQKEPRNDRSNNHQSEVGAYKQSRSDNNPPIKAHALKLKSRETCNHCGKLHGGDTSTCAAKMHPNHNPDGKISWANSKVGKTWASLNPPHSSLVLKSILSDDGKSTRDIPQEIWLKIKERLDRGAKDNKPSRYGPQDKKKGNISLLTCLNTTIPCCSHNDEYVHAEMIKIKAWIGHGNTSIFTHLLMDPGCLQANLIRKDLALKLQKHGAIFESTSNEVMSGVGSNRRRVRITHQVRFRLMFDVMKGVDSSVNRFCDVMALIIDASDFPLIIGLPTIQNYQLLHILEKHLASFPQLCEMCSDNNLSSEINSTTSINKKTRCDSEGNVKTPSEEGMNSRVVGNPEFKPKLNGDNKIKVEPKSKSPSVGHMVQHVHKDSVVDTEKIVLINYINSIAHSNYSKNNSLEELNEVADLLHISDVFNYEEDDDEIQDGDITEILQKDTDVLSLLQIEGDDELKTELRELCTKYKDIFSTTVKSTPAKVPPLKFDFNKELWQRTANRLPPRILSQEKQEALSVIIDELLALGVIRPSKATAWSQVMLVKKSTGGWRLTIDYRQLNHLVEN